MARAVVRAAVETLYQVDSGYACGGVVAVDGIVVEAAPIFRRLIGQQVETIGYRMTPVGGIVAKKKAGSASSADTSVLEEAGFESASQVIGDDGRLRVEAMSVEGMPDGGKTSFSLSASEMGPVAFLRNDSGSGIMDWYRGQGRVILDKKIIAEVPDNVEVADLFEVSELMMPKLQEFRHACRKAIEARVPACVIDTGTALHELVGYALNGKVSLDVKRGEGKLRAAVNSAMASLFRLFENAPDTNLIVTHRLGEYDGNIYPMGWRAINYEVPYVVRCEYDFGTEDDEYQKGDPDTKKRFWVRIIKAKYNVEELQGKRFRVSRLSGYTKIAKMLLPGGVEPAGEDE